MRSKIKDRLYSFTLSFCFLLIHLTKAAQNTHLFRARSCYGVVVVTSATGIVPTEPTSINSGIVTGLPTDNLHRLHHHHHHTIVAFWVYTTLHSAHSLLSLFAWEGHEKAKFFSIVLMMIINISVLNIITSRRYMYVGFANITFHVYECIEMRTYCVV